MRSQKVEKRPIKYKSVHDRIFYIIDFYRCRVNPDWKKLLGTRCLSEGATKLGCPIFK